MNEKKSEVMYIRITPETKIRIRKLADAERRRYTDMICVLLDEAIENRERKLDCSISL